MRFLIARAVARHENNHVQQAEFALAGRGSLRKQVQRRLQGGLGEECAIQRNHDAQGTCPIQHRQSLFVLM
jgi:hypothetical protein